MQKKKKRKQILHRTIVRTNAEYKKTHKKTQKMNCLEQIEYTVTTRVNESNKKKKDAVFKRQ